MGKNLGILLIPLIFRFFILGVEKKRHLSFTQLWFHFKGMGYGSTSLVVINPIVS